MNGRVDFDPSQFKRVQDDARLRTILERSSNPNLYVQREVLRRGHTISAQHQSIELDRDTVMVFVDDAPLLNWGHPCRYLLYEPESASLYRTVDAMFPPYMTERPSSFDAFHKPVVFARPSLVWEVGRIPRWTALRPASEWFAVLFSGASDNRHTNDLEFLYRTLREDYDVPAGNIYVLNYDGTINYANDPHPVESWPGDGTEYTMSVSGQGTKADLEGVFDELKGRLRESDKLLIHTNNHGGHNGESFLVTYSGPSYGASDFADKIAELPKMDCLMVMMEQCFAGGFNAGIVAGSQAEHTSVASAAVESNTSIGGADFDPFARDWIAAMRLAMPDGSPLGSDPDTDDDGAVRAREAYDYADLVHHPHDTPNYSQSSWQAGECRLGTERIRFRIPELYDIWWDLIPQPLPDPFTVLERLRPELEKIRDEAASQVADVQGWFDARVREVIEGAVRGGSS